MAKVAVMIFRGAEKCGPMDIPNTLTEHFANVQIGRIECSVAPIEGGEVAIVVHQQKIRISHSVGYGKV